MQELIKIQVSKGGKQVVSARELHQFLGIKTAFGIWIERMTKYGFVENTDYAVIKSERADNQVITIQDFVITIDMAKELSMIQRTDKGKQARLYFIECERLSKHPIQQVVTQPLPTDFISALEHLLVSKKSELALEEKLKEAQPKVELFDMAMSSRDTLEMSQVAKILCIKGFGRNNIFERLRDEKVLRDTNEPYQEYINRGWFKIIETPYNKEGESRISTKTVVLQKGIEGIRQILTKPFQHN
jgi:anti-repressor protein